MTDRNEIDIYSLANHLKSGRPMHVALRAAGYWIEFLESHDNMDSAIDQVVNDATAYSDMPEFSRGDVAEGFDKMIELKIDDEEFNREMGKSDSTRWADVRDNLLNDDDSENDFAEIIDAHMAAWTGELPTTVDGRTILRDLPYAGFMVWAEDALQETRDALANGEYSDIAEDVAYSVAQGADSVTEEQAKQWITDNRQMLIDAIDSELA